MAKTAPFEEYPEQYEAWFERNEFAYESELLAVKKLLPKQGRGIEIGVGSGRFAEPLGITFGVEPSKNMRELAIKRGITAIDGIAENLPIRNASFDFVLMVTTICFLDDIDKSLKESYRILRERGCIIIGFVDKDSPIGKLYQRNKSRSLFYHEATFLSFDDVTSYLKNTGFNNFSFYQTIFNSLKDIKKVEPIKEGFGEGSFIVIKGEKRGRKK